MARLVKQDPVLRKEFQERIKQKVQNKKDKMKREMDEELPAVTAWVAKPLAGLFFDRINAKNMEKGDSGEFNVFLHAKTRLPNEWIVFNDVVVEPEPGKLTQIDHIIIGPPGLFIVETKAWKGSYSAYMDTWKYCNGKEWIKCKHNPTKQNAYHATAIHQWLEGTGILSVDAPPGSWITPVVVFTKADRLKTTECSMPVFNGTSELIAYLKTRSERYLDQENTEKIATLIQYPRLNEALRYDKIKWTGMDDAASSANKESQDMESEQSENKPCINGLPDYIEGTTKEGRRYVRITGTLKQAEAVNEHFKALHPNVDAPRKDRFKNNTSDCVKTPTPEAAFLPSYWYNNTR